MSCLLNIASSVVSFPCPPSIIWSLINPERKKTKMFDIYHTKALYTFYYTDTSVLLENTPLVKFIRNHIRDSSGIVSISSLVKISIISLTSSLSLRLHLNSLVRHRNIFGSSLKVFGNLRTFSENVRQRSDNFYTIFGKSSKTP